MSQGQVTMRCTLDTKHVLCKFIVQVALWKKNLVKSVVETFETYNIFIAFTSVTGPESPKVYGNAAGRTYYRGRKRSLYDGGLRVPFRVWGQDGITNPSRLMGGVDWFSTSLSLLDVGTNIDSRDGLDMAGFLTGVPSEQVDIDRSHRPLYWEWRYAIPGHCVNDSPRFAVMVDSKKKYLTNGPNGRKELYIVHSPLTTTGHYERNNMLSINPNQYRNFVNKASMLLRGWSRKPARRGNSYPHAGCRRPEKRWRKLLPKLSVSEEDTIRRAVPPVGVVFMLADDLGIGDVAVYNQNRKFIDWLPGERVAYEPFTPNIDTLARHGVMFTNYYTSASICSPTRASILTGRYPFHKDVAMHFQVDNEPPTIEEEPGVTPYLGFEDKTSRMYLGNVFRDAGYKTAHFGKWHLGKYPRGIHTKSGKDLWRLPTHESYGFDKVRAYAHSGGLEPSETFNNSNDTCFAAHIQKDIVDEAIRFIEERIARDEKFFVNLWFQNAHAPLNLATWYDQAAELGYPFESHPFGKKNLSGLSRFPNRFLDKHLSLQIYRALVKDHDLQVGRLMSFLKNNNMDDKVLIVYSSDNGPEYPGMYHASVGSANPFRGGKRSLFEGGLRAPFIMKWDTVIPKGRLKDTIASSIDVMPTLQGILQGGHSVRNQSFDGRDLFSVDLETSRPVLFEYRGMALGGDCTVYSPRFAVRKNEFKLYLEPKDPRQTVPKKFEPVHLFNVVEDPSELDDLIQSRRRSRWTEVIKELTAIVRDYVHSDKYDSKYKTLGNFSHKRRRSYLQCREWLTNSSFAIGKRFRWAKKVIVDPGIIRYQRKKIQQNISSGNDNRYSKLPRN
uniref:Sulfatase N-terminal domain-containing protein n=1 Tax=Mucochytrium quahogii TaxID=96639 RepID=A0A7S2WIY9_9STRA|mmetsp:Transcript_246/g.521  ORF Transcript_246/g.521 Transcript_246/m.521 type:complete len:837 (+) Transcript_246:924-3434(+)